MTTLTTLASAPLVVRLRELLAPIGRLLDLLTPVGDLLLRLWVAAVFFKSGLVKIQSFDSTLLLFEYEYAVPLLPSDIAAYLATAIELCFPLLLALGLAGRFSALVLFVFNIAAVLSYPGLNPVGVEQHQVWGIMLLVSLLHGPGRLSLDHLIGRLARRG